MPSTANVGITLLTTGVCTGGHESLWTTSTVLAVLAVLVSVVSMGFSLWSWYREHLRRLVLDQTGNSMTDLILDNHQRRSDHLPIKCCCHQCLANHDHRDP